MTDPARPVPVPSPPAGPASSELPGFYRLDLPRRRAELAERAGLTLAEQRVVSGEAGLDGELADHLVENALGTFGLPLGLCVNLRVDGRDRLVPLAIEEASVIAAASHGAKLLRSGEGIGTVVGPAVQIGQVQLLEVPDPVAATRAILDARPELLQQANAGDPLLVRLGGGAQDLEVRHLPPDGPADPVGPMLIVHLLVDVRDAMGANLVNTMCERLAGPLARLAGGRARLRILSNLADRRLVRAVGRVPLALLAGKGEASPAALARGIEEASVFAGRDPYRAATHNKGIMNGVDAVLLAHGQDWRAVEAGAHAYAARAGRYTALARWRVAEGELVGELALPLCVGVVGGATAAHPFIPIARKIGGIISAAELSSCVAAVGLAQNLAALRALAAEGIQRGHLRAHARTVALAAGARGPEVAAVATALADAGELSAAAAGAELRRRRQATPADADHWRGRFAALGETYLPALLAQLESVVADSSAGSSLATLCRYHLATGGKRLRAILPLLVAEAVGADPGGLVPFGAACEMLHNATLVHDDLQDRDRFRRGQETVWHRFGASRAVNLGDAMLYYALLLVQRLEVPIVRREEAARRLLQETLRVIDGQEREALLLGQRWPVLADYTAMVERKTSGLFALPLAGAAALCGQPPEVVEALQEAAQHLGVLFQIQDDLLDLYGDKGREAPGNDLREGKRSILVVHALQTAPAAEADRLAAILDRDRDATTAAEVAQARRILEQVEAPSFARTVIAQRRAQALAVPGLAEHPGLRGVIAALADLFLAPLDPVAPSSPPGARRG